MLSKGGDEILDGLRRGFALEASCGDNRDGGCVKPDARNVIGIIRIIFAKLC